MARPRRLPLLLAAALAALAALLLAISDGPGTAAASAPPPEFRHWLRTEEVKRLRERRVLPPVAAAAPDPFSDGTPAPPRRDPFLVALSRDPSRPLLVLEANALRHSRLGELFVECVFGLPGRDPFDQVRRELGLDPLKDVDRVAISDEGMVISGFFERAHFQQLARDSDLSRYGDAGRVYRPRGSAGEPAAPGPGPEGFATWGANMILLGSGPFVEQSIDRLEGRAPEAPPVIPENLTYGEAYGVLTGQAIGALFRGDQSELGRRLAEVAPRIELHVDAMRDVAISASFSGPDGHAVDDLGSALGGALAVARLQARAGGDERLAQLLEHARVVRGAEGFLLELAIPVTVLEGWFSGCGASSNPARE
jgi:hypothetical protein